MSGIMSVDYEDLTNDNQPNMHQSFINLIYPSMSKKLATNDINPTEKSSKIH